MNLQNDKQESILQRIAEGSLSIDSKEEFDDLLALFPDKADIKRAYADFLSVKKENRKACQNYLLAADAYIREGKTIQAIVSKILAWRIIKPNHQEGRAFHAALQAGLAGDTPLRHFFSGMPYPEFIAIMLKLTRMQMPAGKRITTSGKPGSVLYFIVSGELEETFHPAAKAEKSGSPGLTQRLSDNDIFGEVLPLDSGNICQWDVVSLSHTEVVKISKTALVEISRKYPLIEKRLTKIYKDPSAAKQNRAWVSVRRSARHMTPVKIDLKIIPAKQPEKTLNVEAMSKDISVGGVCIDLGLTHESLPVTDLVGTRAELSIDLPNADQSLAISGTVVWGKKIKEAAGVGIVAGIQFDRLDRETRDLLNVYCFGIDSEQALMWSLWDNYMGG